MTLQELNKVIESLENQGEIELLGTYYMQRSNLIKSLSSRMKNSIRGIINEHGLNSLSIEQFQLAQYLESTGQLR